MASIGRERVHCFNFLRSLYQCLAYFFNFFNFLFHYLIAFFLETNTKLVGTHEVSLIGALILYFCLKNVETHTHCIVKKGQQIIILLLAINYLQRKLFSVMLSLWLLLFNEDWFQCVWQSVHCSGFRVYYTPQILKQLLVNNNWVLFMYMGKLIQLVLCCLLQIAWIILYH